ncbi:hypothetical protein QO034_20485 [Sedimentitalea sp. JM2-8]|uniref:Beta-barrel assembly machine subunit BamF n=2 Tax=Sedimentitalea xiamensis TaxID=3050037 RepID=A0ABT7FK11_9RHOB|nr:hypothetical protein [Sedimentitalea xiamensis]
MSSARNRFSPRFACLLALPFVAGCANVPDLASTVPASLEDADYPALVPIETLLVPLPAPRDQSDDIRASLESRRDSLRVRADRLNTTVVDDETRKRMQAGVPR